METRWCNKIHHYIDNADDAATAANDEDKVSVM